MRRLAQPIATHLYNQRLGYRVHVYEAAALTRISPPLDQHSRARLPYALSLLDSLPTDLGRAEAILAWSPEASLEGLLRGGVEQEQFVAFMQAAIAASHPELCLIFGGRAARLPEGGWMHLVDERAITPFGRTADSDDIIGLCRAEGGAVLPSSYTMMPTYRLVSPLGLFSPPKPLYQALIKKLM